MPPSDEIINDNEPISMFLTCPKCNARHIDEGDFAKKSHHTHSCQACGLTWRPAIGPTFGVAFLPGFKNEASQYTKTFSAEYELGYRNAIRAAVHECNRIADEDRFIPERASRTLAADDCANKVSQLLREDPPVNLSEARHPGIRPCDVTEIGGLHPRGSIPGRESLPIDLSKETSVQRTETGHTFNVELSNACVSAGGKSMCGACTDGRHAFCPGGACECRCLVMRTAFCRGR